MEPQSAIPPNDTAAEASPAAEVHTEFRYIEAYEDVCDRCDLFNMQNAMSQCRSCGWRECRACTIENGGRRTHRVQGRTHFSPVDVTDLMAQATADHEQRVARLGGWMAMSRRRGHARRWISTSRRREEEQQHRGRGRRSRRGRRGNRQHCQAPAPAPTPEATAAPSPAASLNTGEAILNDARAPETAEGAEMLYALGLEDSASRRSESGSPATEEERRTIRAPFLILAKRAREEFETQQTDRASKQ
ncbi:hypothetical protein BO83DRAFT_413882 [Aspergillus eucalypticola CBS 122712]|uniref:Uncharacterized protein n=1 Tax=Aspergillus eucalypticola (strain CBS 122712 / IBT 29274) TaxID=1448314 RepID=A0A317W6L7_ASPEC|nr:uncharacterized protein BO83DRAFT_413882 [Aspergillus eucalypticola CBS 122712]PWY82264.1 hypothetical protein BO83DRAFT_413882 [Aspergillus eucalypticola CBS 122712]